MSRDILDLHPLLRPICIEHMRLFKERSPDILCILSFTWRSNKEQDELFYQGRSSSGKIVNPKLIVTNARGGQSWHNITYGDVAASLAYDLWLGDAKKKALPATDHNWQILGNIGLRLGLEWGVLLKANHRWDLGHFYLRGVNNITLAEAKSGIQPIAKDIQPSVNPPVV